MVRNEQIEPEQPDDAAGESLGLPQGQVKDEPQHQHQLEHQQLIAERGRRGWQKASGHNWRALVEADISRYKRVIADALRSRTDARQAAEVGIAVCALHRMLELGRPEAVRIA